MNLVQPTPDMRVFIRKEFREPENPEDVEKDVAAIREWLERQPHLPKDMDDGRIRTFLRGCKFSLEKVKRKLDMYYTMRNACPEFFSNRDVERPELAELFKIGQAPFLPGLTPQGRRVCIMRGISKDIPTPNMADCIKLVLMAGDVRLKEEQYGVSGDVYIFDASAATPGHFSKISPAVVKKIVICFQEAYPVKLKEIHVINVSPIVETICNFVKPLLKEKIKQRIHFHSNLDSLYKFVPQKMLPKEYGGESGNMDDLTEQWRLKLRDYTPWFKEQEDKKANEALRPGAPKTADDLFGMSGSFRQLSID